MIYGLSWSERRDKPFRLALGSFIEEYSNKVTIVQLKENNRNEQGFLQEVGSFDHSYPATKIQWYPSSSTSANDLLATSGDYLRLWQVRENEIVKQNVFNAVCIYYLSYYYYVIETAINMQWFKNTNSEYCAPLTSFDWNRTDPTMIGTSSIDTTCTIWDISTGKSKTQLIAHDKEVYDIAFATKGKDIFSSVGADGSVRMFDLRNLEHSTILYETADLSPLLRLSWNKQDSNYLATFGMDSKAVIVLDIRVPGLPVAELKAHTSSVNAIAWAPHSSCHICSAGDDCQALIWDLSSIPNTSIEPILSYKAKAEINQLQWSAEHMDWIAIAVDSTLQILRV